MPHAKLFNRQDRCAQLERQIQSETLRQMRRLEVRVAEGQTLIRGAAPSYYVRQLAERTAMDLVPREELELAISVDFPGDAPRTPYDARPVRNRTELALV